MGIPSLKEIVSITTLDYIECNHLTHWRLFQEQDGTGLSAFRNLRAVQMCDRWYSTKMALYIL